MPTIAPIAVVKAIIQALDDQHSQTIYLPFYVSTMPYLQHLPSYLRDLMQWVSVAELLIFPVVFVDMRPSRRVKETMR